MIYFRSEPAINARHLSRSYFARALSVRAHDAGERSGVGIKQQVTLSLTRLFCEIVRLWANPLEFYHRSRENHAPQKSRWDGGTLEYVFEAGEQNSPDAITKEKVAEIAADLMTTFYHGSARWRLRNLGRRGPILARVLLGHG